MNNAQVLRDALTGAIAATGKDTEILDAVHIRVADRVLHVVGTDRFIVAMHAAPTDMEDFAQVSISTAEAKRLLKNLKGASYVALQVDGDTLHVQADGDLDGYQILYGQAPDFTKMGQRHVPCPNAFTRLNSGIFAALAKLPENKKKGLAFDVEILGMPGDQHHNTLPKMMRFTRGAWTFMAMLQRHEGV